MGLLAPVLVLHFTILFYPLEGSTSYKTPLQLLLFVELLLLLLLLIETGFPQVSVDLPKPLISDLAKLVILESLTYGIFSNKLLRAE